MDKQAERDIFRRLRKYNRSGGHSQIRIEEYFAKRILEDVGGFRGIIVDDKPDLQVSYCDMKIGIEVVDSASFDYHALWSGVDYDDAAGMGYVYHNTKTVLRAFEKYFFANGDGSYNVSLTLCDGRRIAEKSFGEIKTVFDDKFNKLVSYANMQVNCLFIFARPNLFFCVNQLDDLQTYFSSKCNGLCPYFSYVFIFTEWELYCFSMSDYICISCRDRVLYLSDAALMEVSSVMLEAGF